MSEELERGIPKAIVTGKIEFTEEEKIQNRIEFVNHLKKLGIIEENEPIEKYLEII